MASSKDRSTPAKQLPDFDLMLFGGTGDLAMRKLLPALFRRYLAGQFPAHARIVGVARSSIEPDDYLAQVEESSKKFLPAGLDTMRWTAFSRTLDYVCLDATNSADYQRLAVKLVNNPAQVRVFFLSTAPALFRTICRNLAAAQLVTPGARVVLEKPLGQDFASAIACSNRCGAAAGFVMCRSPWPKNSASKGAARSMTRPAHCATWCRTICCSCCASWRWNRRYRITPMRCATRSSRCCAR